ncbi:hypothetical protein ACKVAX_26235 [Klebsiella pasteurii]|uniref:hypothetical protein n=1 Tax=Klebsiella pasteurii TaxID=2587529 RepID=UPI003F195201
MAGFLLSATGLSIELRSIIRRSAAHPFGASATSALFNACGVSPSPGTTYSENPAYGWVFAFSTTGLSIELRSIIRRTAAHPFGASATSALFNAAALVRVRAPLFKEPSLWLGFYFSATGLSIELRSIIRRSAAHPFGASATSALFNACGVSPSPGTTYSENPPKSSLIAE